MKKHLTPMNILTFFIICFLLYQKVPLWINAYKVKGTTITSTEVRSILPSTSSTKVQESKPMLFPNPDGNTMAIFWASWCGPCKVEMERLKTSVNDGKIAKNKIFAINPFEDVETIKQFINKSAYPFTFIHYEQELDVLNVSVTPTTIFLKGNQIDKVESGMSLTGIWSAENFLK